MANNSWMCDVQFGPGAALEVNASSIEATAGDIVILRATLSNVGAATGNWSLSATAVMPPPPANASSSDDAAAAGANATVAELLREQLTPATPLPSPSALSLSVSQRSVLLPADADAAARRQAASALPRSPALPLLLSLLKRSPPPAPPPPRAARRLLQQQLAPAVTSPNDAAGVFYVRVNTSAAQTGNHSVLVAARSLADNGTTVYARVSLRVAGGVDAGAAARAALLAQLGSPLVTAFAGRVASELEQLAARAAAAPPAVTALSGPSSSRTTAAGLLASLLGSKTLASAAAASAATATQALQQLSRAAAALPPQPSARDAIQQLALQWLALLSGGALDWTALGTVASAALASMRNGLLLSLGFASYVPPPPSPPPPMPPAMPPPPPPTAVAALGDLLRGAGALLRGAG
jgi:hypothetical protein